jgi:hypothetical protein
VYIAAASLNRAIDIHVTIGILKNSFMDLLDKKLEENTRLSRRTRALLQRI